MPDLPRGRRPTNAASRGVASAFDEARFGPERTLNLRASMPTAADAVHRADAWLRERQAANAGEVLIITGRGRGSPGGIPVVREAVARLFPSLKRAGVIADVGEHDPGSFVVRLASLQALVNAPRRRLRPTPVPPRNPDALRGLNAATLAMLRRLAVAALAAHGVRDPSESFVNDEMARHFSHLALAADAGQDPAAALGPLLARALEEYDA
jgi:hypothetical protein